MIRLLPALLLTFIALARTASLAAAPIAIEAHYECFWWAPEQMVDFDPSHPPPKTTRIRLDHWEYSDPVGVPHPDTVILVVTLRSATSRDLALSVRTRFLTGAWTKSTTASSQKISLAAGVAQTLEIPIPVALMINQHDATRLRSSIVAGATELTHADLRIILGD
jgi:hypothetical protein